MKDSLAGMVSTVESGFIGDAAFPRRTARFIAIFTATLYLGPGPDLRTQF
jgi:hypothetical protein